MNSKQAKAYTPTNTAGPHTPAAATLCFRTSTPCSIGRALANTIRLITITAHDPGTRSLPARERGA